MNRTFNNTKKLGLLLIFSLLFCGLELSAQAKGAKVLISGLVRDAHTKKPIRAAQISILNTKSSATTDESGHFTIEAPNKKALLTVRAYDYNVREVAVRGADSVIVSLYPDNFSSYSKNINTANGEVTNSMLTTGVKTVSDLSQSLAFTADEALQSELGGDVRSISRSALSGIGSSLFIRGLNSLNANAQPLFVVDGVVWSNLTDQYSIHQGFYSNPLSNIDMNDIESISVMKDGTSVYGSKAANGVVLIKTKRGTGMATKINLSIVTGMTTTPKTVPVLGANDYKIYATDMLGSAGLTTAEIAQLPYLNDNPKRSTYNLYHNNTNWADEVYQTAVSKSYSINVNGGDEKALYYLSLGYSSSDGVVKTTNSERYNMRFNGDIILTKRVSLAINAGFARTERTLLDDGVNAYTSPTYLSLVKSPLLSPNTFTFSGERTTEYAVADIFGFTNPSALFKYANNTVKQDYFNFSVKPEIKLSKALKLTETFDYTLNKTNEDYYRPYQYASPIFMEGTGYSYNSRESQVMRNNSIFSDARLSFDKQLGVYSHVNAVAGSRYLVNDYESDYVEGHNSKSNTSINLLGGFSDLYTTGINNQTKSISNYVNVDYNYDNRYLLSVAASMDASSRFGNETLSGVSMFGRNWGIFPSVNGAWIVSSQKFMKNLPIINLLKLRAGFGLTGNDDIKDYQTEAYFSSVRLKGVGNGMVLSSLANPKIQWETTSRANVGVDLSVLNDRLSLSADLYSSVTKNLLVMKTYQDAVGLNAHWTNEGEMTNKGIELAFNAKLLNLRNFHWELGASAGHYVNKITGLPNGSFTTDVYDGQVLSAVGYSAGVFYGYKTLGVFASKADAAAANLKMLTTNGTYTTFGAGDVIFEDVADATGKKDGIINENDKQVIGNPNPKVYGTVTNTFSYRHFTLTTLFTYSYGNDVYNYQRTQLEAGKDYSNQSTTMLARWTSEGQTTTQPKAVYGDPMGNARFSDRWIEDGSYIRLKTLKLSYNLPIKSTFLEGINFWVSANNVFTITHYLGADPEFSTQNATLFQGVDAGLIPFSKSYNIGLKFSL